MHAFTLNPVINEHDNIFYIKTESPSEELQSNLIHDLNDDSRIYVVQNRPIPNTPIREIKRYAVLTFSSNCDVTAFEGYKKTPIGRLRMLNNSWVFISSINGFFIHLADYPKYNLTFDKTPDYKCLEILEGLVGAKFYQTFFSNYTKE